MGAMQTDDPIRDPKPIQTLMGESTLANIIQKAQILNKIDDLIADFLPETIGQFCHVMNLKEHCLVLGIRNSAAATRIRYQEEELLNHLNRQTGLPTILKLECVVRP